MKKIKGVIFHKKKSNKKQTYKEAMEILSKWQFSSSYTSSVDLIKDVRSGKLV